MATATYTHPQQSSSTDPEALKRSLLSLSFPFVEVTAASDLALDTAPRLLNRRMAPIPEELDAWSPPSTPELSSAASSASSSRHNSLPSTPLLTPSFDILPLPIEDKATDYFDEHEHPSLRAKLAAWGANHLHALEALVAPDDEDEDAATSTCVPAPRVVPENARILPASTGAHVRFLVRPMPPKHDVPKPKTQKQASYTQRLSPLLAAVACALLGFGEADDLLGDEAYEFAEDGFELDL